MKKYTRLAALPIMVLILIVAAAQTLTAQQINDGCMRIRPYVHDTWLQEFEDPFETDEVALFWYAADNANLDGQGWRTNGFMYFQATNWIGWRTVFDGGDDQAAAFPLTNLFDQTYGTANTTLTSSVPQYLQIRGSYTGDDCGAQSGCESCLFDDDDYCYDDVLNTTLNYRFAPPNQNSATVDVFTFNHGAPPPGLGGGSNFGARVGVNWSSPIPTGITASPATSVCSGGSITLTATGGAVFGGTYIWETASGTPVGNGTTITVTPTVNTTYRVFCSNGGIKSLCYKEIDLFVSSTPVSNNTISSSSPAGPFCVTGDPGIVTGNTPTVSFVTWNYQWETSTDGGANWNIASGPFSSAVLPYQFDPAATSQTLLVRRVVSTGGCSNSSNVITYNIEQPIGNNIIDDDQILCGAGTPIDLTGTLPTGGNGVYGYQWQSSTTFGGPYGNINNANSQNYSPGILTGTTYFRRQITGGVCAPSVSNIVTVTVQPVIAGNTIGAPQEFCNVGNPVTLTGTGTLSGGTGVYTYQWQESTDGGITWAASPSITDSYDPPIVIQTTLYRRGVYSGVCFSNSPNVAITVYPLISNNSISANQASCGQFTAGTLVGTTPAGGNGSYTYVWEQNVNNGGWNVIGGASGANYSPGVVSVTTQYRRTVNSLPCSDVSNEVTITITPTITVNTIGTSQTFCVSGDPGTLTGAVPTGGNGAFTYQWQSSPDGFTWTNIGAATGQSYAPGVITATTYFMRNAFSGSCSLGSNAVTITIVPAITGNSISADQTFCGNGDPAVLIGSTPSGGTGSYNYQWFESTDNITFTPIGSATNQNYDPGTLTVTTYFRRDATSSVCPSSSNAVTVTVVPVLANNTIDDYQRFCGPADPAIINGSTPTGGTGVYTYQWESSPNGATWTPIASANGVSYDPPFTSTTVYYHRLVFSSVCSSVSNTNRILILLSPQITQVTPTALLCNGDSTGSIFVTGTSTNGPAYYSIDGGNNYQSSGLFSNLAAGSYNVYITDDSACVTAYAGNSVVVTEPAVLSHTTVSQNASCDNVFDGSITVNTTGGTTAYSYSLNGGPSQPGNVFNGLADGSYFVLVTDAHGCTDTSTVVIDTAYAVYASLVSQTPVSCYGGLDGTVTVQLTGGVPPYSYSINGIQFVSSPTFTGLASGNYIVTLRDSKGCTDFVNVTITQPSQLYAQIDSIDNIGCSGATTGAIYITVFGGNTPYSFLWSDNSTNEDITGLTAGTYNVAITDAKGCTASVGATISQPLPLFLNVASYHNLQCYNDSSGSIDITANGGVPPYSFVWSSGDTTEDIFDLLPGNYSVVVTDANGCQQSIAQVITEPTQLVSSISSTPVLCAGAASGGVDLTVTGGTPPYNYVWSNGATSQDLDSVAGGLYTVIVYDANGCSIANSVTVTEPAPITIAFVKTDVLCNGDSTGAIDITVNGGTPVITYAWSNNETSEDISLLPAGSYSVTITDGNNCTASVATTISQPAGLVLNATPVNVSCAGGANGAIDITVQGGVFPYNYNWSNNDTTEDINGLNGGTYTVEVTDANGCSITATFTITEPNPLTSTLVGTNVTCFGAANGSIDLTAGGGTAPYTYLWNTFQTVEDLDSVGGGTYFVIITDANGCTLHDSIVITEAPVLVLSLAVTNIICNGDSTGAIDLTVTGGAPAYTYLWSNNETTEDISNLPAGNYTVEVTDAAGCSASASAVVTQSNPIVINSSTQNVSCAGGNDGYVDISVQGGTFPYTYAWSNTTSSEDIRNVIAGTYTVVITDAAGCTVTASYTLTEPTGIISSVVGKNVTCNGSKDGEADLTVSGGVGPYRFLWSTFQGSEDITGLSGGLYYVIITDANGCEKRDSVLLAEPAPIVVTLGVTQITCFNANDGIIDLTVTGGTPGYRYAWSNNATTQDLSNLPGGQYVVVVTDTNGCTATGSTTIVNPSAIFANFFTKNPLCNGDTSGRIDLIASGGTPPYTFNWSNNATTEDLINVGAGTYIVTITDSRNCSHIDSASITEPGQIFTSGVVKNVTCAGLSDGFADITAYAGTLPYDYKWSTLQTTEDIFSIPGGDYYVTVTDANGCQAVSLYTIAEPQPLGISVVKTDVLCNGAATGTLAVIPTGGVRPYYYLWNHFATDSALVGVTAGHYTILLTDSNGCFIYDSVDVLQPAALAIAGTTTDAVCWGSATGIVDITVTGGVTNYSYLWSNNAATQDLNGVAANTYTVVVTDANTCSLSASFTVGQGTRILPNLASLDPICSGGNTGSISALTTGGAQPYTYAWSNGKSTIAIGTLVAGTYTLTVTDALNCTASDSVVINNPAPIVVVAAANGAKCFNTATGNVSTVVTGGFGPYTYQLNGVAQSTDTFQNLLPGDYLLLVTDVNGCQGSVSFGVASPQEISVDLTVVDQVILTGMQTQLVATATSISPILNYYWTPEKDTNNRVVFDYSNCGDPLNCANPLVAPRVTTTFTVTVMSADSCYSSDTVTVQVLNQPSAFIPTAFTPNNDGLNDRFEFDILGSENIEVAIFDRWGQRVFYNPAQVNGINKGSGWDGTVNGKPAPFDTYVYQITIKYFDDVSKDLTGTVTIMK